VNIHTCTTVRDYVGEGTRLLLTM